MPRDVNGTYTLPTGNPVQSGEPIESVWANTTMSDVASELTNSLDRFGRGGMLAPFFFTDGTPTDPGLAFVNEISTGFRRAGTGDLRAVTLGVDVMRFWNGRAQVPVGGGAWADVVAPGLPIAGPLKLANDVYLTGLTSGAVEMDLVGISPGNTANFGDAALPLYLNAAVPPTWWDGAALHVLSALNVAQTWLASQTFNAAPVLAHDVSLLGKAAVGATTYPLLSLSTTDNRVIVGEKSLAMYLDSIGPPQWRDSTSAFHPLVVGDWPSSWSAQMTWNYGMKIKGINNATIIDYPDSTTVTFGDRNKRTYIAADLPPIWIAPSGGNFNLVHDGGPQVAQAGGRYINGGAATQADGWGGLSITLSGNNFNVSWSNPYGKTKALIFVTVSNGVRFGYATTLTVNTATLNFSDAGGILKTDVSFSVAVHLY